MSEKSIIVQSDYTILLETNSPEFETIRDELSLFTELIKSPEFIYTYKISNISLWNAASMGMTFENISETLTKYSKYDIPKNVSVEIKMQLNRFGQIEFHKKDKDEISIDVKNDIIFRELANHPKLRKFSLQITEKNKFTANIIFRGDLKLIMTKLGYPVTDLAGYENGEFLDINTVEKTNFKNLNFTIRDYQLNGIDIFYANGSNFGGSGVIVLPCGAGKTIVGIGIISKLKTETLIISTNITAIRQWKSELIDKTNINPELIGEYSGEIKEVKPITIASYQILTYKKSKEGEFAHFKIFNERNWGLIIYDEVHLLPAQVFRIVSSLQSKRRLGLTATLIREDGLQDEVFSLIGPKKYDVPWKVLEKKGWIATSTCTEIRVPLNESIIVDYAVSDNKTKFQIASTNKSKLDVIDQILKKHKNDQILIIGQYLDQLEIIREKYKFPIITGQTPNLKRMELYNLFKEGKIKQLIVSKVANFAIDLPDANVAIQISGTFGSRQEEAQRLGRIIRPKEGDNVAYFYTIVTENSVEQDYAQKRQLFLTEQGYHYTLEIFQKE